MNSKSLCKRMCFTFFHSVEVSLSHVELLASATVDVGETNSVTASTGIDLEFLTLVSPAFLVFSRERGGEEGSTKTVLQKICLSTCLPKLQEFWSMCIYNPFLHVGIMSSLALRLLANCCSFCALRHFLSF